MGLEVFKAYDSDRARALADYYRYARDNDLYLTYVIINPQADRSKSASQQKDPFLSAGVVDRDAEGITVRGAKMLATGGIMANEVFVTCIQPLQPGDEKHAISFVIPMNAKGLKILSRKSYELAAPDVFDNPLASRFDENDAVLYFDDVKVPWERVFVVDSIEMCQKQFHATPAHVYQNYQAQIRLAVKLRFLLGIAHRIADINGIAGFPPGARDAGPARGGSRHGRRLRGGHGGEGDDAWSLFRAGPTYALCGADPDTAALCQGDQHAARTRRRRTDHAAVVGEGLRQSGNQRADREDAAVACGERR